MSAKLMTIQDYEAQIAIAFLEGAQYAAASLDALMTNGMSRREAIELLLTFDPDEIPSPRAKA